MSDTEDPVEVENQEDDLAEVEDDEEYVPAGGAAEVKLFGKWSFDDIEIRDISLVVCWIKP